VEVEEVVGLDDREVRARFEVACAFVFGIGLLLDLALHGPPIPGEPFG